MHQAHNTRPGTSSLTAPPPPPPAASDSRDAQPTGSRSGPSPCHVCCPSPECPPPTERSRRRRLPRRAEYRAELQTAPRSDWSRTCLPSRAGAGRRPRTATIRTARCHAISRPANTPRTNRKSGSTLSELLLGNGDSHVAAPLVAPGSEFCSRSIAELAAPSVTPAEAAPSGR